MADGAPDPLLALERGLAVFPLPAGGNRPVIRGWQRSALCDVEQVRRRWRPGDNVGIGCWRSGVVGLDLDVADGRHHTDIAGADTLAAQCAAHGQPWPDTLTIGTPSGGQHLYFRVPAGRLITSSSGGRSGLGPGIDVRGPGRGGRGSYLIGPDSIVGGRRRYEIARDVGIAELPAWLGDLLEQPSANSIGRERRGDPPRRNHHAPQQHPPHTGHHNGDQGARRHTTGHRTRALPGQPPSHRGCTPATADVSAPEIGPAEPRRHTHDDC